MNHSIWGERDIYTPDFREHSKTNILYSVGRKSKCLVLHGPRKSCVIAAFGRAHAIQYFAQPCTSNIFTEFGEYLK